MEISKKNQLTVPHTKSVTSPLSLENLANASADSTQPMMLPRWGTLLTYGSAEVMRTLVRPGRGWGAGAESSASRVAEAEKQPLPAPPSPSPSAASMASASSGQPAMTSSR